MGASFLGYVLNDALVEVTVTVVLAYSSFALCEDTSVKVRVKSNCSSFCVFVCVFLFLFLTVRVLQCVVSLCVCVCYIYILGWSSVLGFTTIVWRFVSCVFLYQCIRE